MRVPGRHQRQEINPCNRDMVTLTVSGFSRLVVGMARALAIRVMFFVLSKSSMFIHLLWFSQGQEHDISIWGSRKRESR